MKSNPTSPLSRLLVIITGILLLLSAAAFLFMHAAHAGTAAENSASADQAKEMRFDTLHLGLHETPPGRCGAAVYGTITARSPDGALCLCHQSYDGEQSLWEQIGTGRPCWADNK
jgi:hypothetical protein